LPLQKIENNIFTRACALNSLLRADSEGSHHIEAVLSITGHSVHPNCRSKGRHIFITIYEVTSGDVINKLLRKLPHIPLD
jgi:hypothetical protein